MIYGGDKHWVARTLSWILACELQILSTGWVVRISHERTLELVRIPRQVDSALSGGQCGGRQAAPVAVIINALVVGVSEGQSSIQTVLCCPVVGAPAGSAHGLALAIAYQLVFHRTPWSQPYAEAGAQVA